MKMKKIGTDDIRKKRNDGKPEEETYKVRVAVTLAHYVLVTAKNHDDAERKVAKYVHELSEHEGLDGWWNEASHINTSFEVEEADEPAPHEAQARAPEDETVPDLAACPKCGALAARIIHPAYDGGAYVHCDKCHYSPQAETWAPTDARAAIKWNNLERDGKS